MLANNICDIEDDLENRRYTLPIYIGKVKALKLFGALYLIAFLTIAALIIVRVLPLTSILIFLTSIPVIKNVRAFNKLQTKKDTFVLSVKNFVLINAAMIMTIAICL
jgi:1,4-dihydroxy-2-naphthoate octaprenyltransferase